jgi:hypothetical protein
MCFCVYVYVLFTVPPREFQVSTMSFHAYLTRVGMLYVYRIDIITPVVVKSDQVDIII